MFTPELESFDLELEKLINRSNNNQWSTDTHIDWDQEVIIPEGLMAETYADMVSQLYYAEEAAIQSCARLIRTLPEFQAKRFLCAQASDEARHAQAYKMYVDRIGGLRPITEDMREIFEEGLVWEGPSWGLVAAMNIVLEHEAIAQQKRRIKELPCPLFRQINQSIIVDESRHCRFGVLYLSRVVPLAIPDERKRVATWLQSMWGRWCNSHVHRYTHPGEEMMHLRQGELEESWKARKEQFSSFGLFDAA